MAYMKCPDCMMPNHVSDDAITFRCFSCFGEIGFQTCTECSYEQAIPSRWHGAFTCGRCEQMVAIPRRRTYSGSTKAFAVQGYGYTYPKF